MKLSFAIDTTTKGRQFTASNPMLSAWVGANAGSGKTFVLARRVIRLLLQGAEPSRILCLTFTKAAAAEMSERVFNALARWATLDESLLRAELNELYNKPITAEEVAAARRLFAQALETPGGLKIQTIHAFCERLLHQFPVEANVAGHFEVLDDAGKAQLVAEAEHYVLLKANDPNETQLSQALSTVIASASDTGYRAALTAFLEKATVLTHWIEQAGGIEGAIQSLKHHFDLSLDDTIEKLTADIMDRSHFPISYLSSLANELKQSSKKFQEQGELANIILTSSDTDQCLEAIQTFFFTKAGPPKKLSSIASSAIVKAQPELEGRVASEQARLEVLYEKQRALATIEATSAILMLSAAVSEYYRKLKSGRGMMDFDDLIEKAASLLEKSDAAAWVHYKLDEGLDHILVDEAQDTSPRQWDIVRHLGEEFFTGKGAREGKRTIFAVGDEKQSIYSFQGASPAKFSEMRRYFETKAVAANEPFEQVPLSLSFRSTADVLGAVDLVFAQAHLKGQLSDNYTPHQAARQNQSGFLELWPPFAQPETPVHDGEWWQPLDHLSEQSAPVQLAEKIADTIAEILETGERLEGTGERITPGDILILAKKRGGQVDAINRALKQRSIPVAGSDRLKLTDSIAILDLIALAEFVLLSEDDLALAGLLKCPLIGMSEDDLFTLAHGRLSTLWDALYVRAQKGEEPFASAHQTLDRWRSEADFTPPFDFFMNILSRDRGREKFLARLGQETNEVLEAFLTEVQNYEQGDVPTLQGFVSWFQLGSATIKRDMEAAGSDVRVMTVHGAKGLEAPIVFLVDGGAPFHNSHLPDLLSLSTDDQGPFIWRQGKDAATQAQKQASDEIKDAAMAEYYRLLYVAMTRARDRLYVTTTANKKGIAHIDGWYSTIASALEHSPHIRERHNAEGERVALRWQVSTSPPVDVIENREQAEPTIKTPDWLTKNASEPPAIKPVLNPSGTHGRSDEKIDPASVAAPSDYADIAPEERGTLIHLLLEKLPDLPPKNRFDIACSLLGQKASTASAETIHGMIKEVIRLLDTATMDPLFNNPNARSEVTITGDLEINGKCHRVDGIIDRLIVEDENVHLIDFKTNRTVPSTMDQVPSAYLRQLALYRALLAPLFPNHTVKASLVWTKNTSLMALAPETLDAALQSIWD